MPNTPVTVWLTAARSHSLERLSRKRGSMMFFWPEVGVPVTAEEIKEYMEYKNTIKEYGLK